MFGRAQTLSFKARASTLQYRAALAYTADNFLAKKALSASLTVFADKTLDVETFTSIRYRRRVSDGREAFAIELLAVPVFFPARGREQI